MINASSIMLLAILIATSIAALAKEQPYRPPRLPDGHVDMQGTWVLINLTPLERRPQFKTLVITPADAARMEAGRTSRLEDRSLITISSEFYDELQVQPIRGELHSSIVVDPLDGQIPGTALFHQKRSATLARLLTAFDGPEDRPPSERCLQEINSAAPIVAIPTRSFHQIVQNTDTIVIANESMHDARIVRMNAEHNPPVMESWLGDTIGWWEGDTLVVESKYFTSAGESRAVGPNVVLVSPQTTVVERFTRTAADALHYAFTVTDPRFYTQPWSGENQFALSTEQMFESACHEGNYALTNILRGARVQEARDAQR